MRRLTHLALVLAGVLGTQASALSRLAQEPVREHDRLLEQAARKMEGQDYEGALQDLELILESPNLLPVVHYQAGVCRTVLGRYAAALESFRQAEKAGIRDWQLWAAYGIAYFKSGDQAASRTYFERVLDSEPGETTALFHLGRMELASGLHANAEKKFRRVLEQEPSHTGALFNLGQSLILQDKDREGRRILQLHQRREHLGERLKTLKAMSSSPQALASVHAELGEVYVELSHPREALKAFQRAEELEPGTALTGLGKGKISYARKDYSTAEKQLARYWNQVEKSCQASLFLGLVLKAQKKVAPAREMLDHAYQKCPRTSLLLLNLGEVEIQSGHPERASELGETMLEVDSQDPAASFLLAQCRLYGRDLEGAERLALEAAELAPKEPNYLRLLATIYRAKGEPEKARAHEKRVRGLLDLAGVPEQRSEEKLGED